MDVICRSIDYLELLETGLNKQGLSISEINFNR